MPIGCRCECGKKLTLKKYLAGKTIRCPDCGNTLKVPGRVRSRPRSRPSTPQHYEIAHDPEYGELPKIHLPKRRRSRSYPSFPYRLVIDIVVRIFGATLFAITFINLVLSFSKPLNKLSEGGMNPLPKWLLLFVFLGIPGLFVVVKGVSFGRSGAANRQKAIFYILGGLGAVAFGVVLFLISAQIAGFLGFMMIPVGFIATGAISFIAGVIALVTGQDMGDAFNR